MHIRKAALSDLDAIRTLLFETWRATFEPLYGPAVIDEICHTWGAPQTLHDRICTDNGKFLVADINGAIAGLAFVNNPTEQGVALLSQLYVAVNFQRQNIGKALLARAEKAHETCLFMRLNVDVKNKPAIGFYKYMGYHDTKISFVRELKEHQVEALIFEKAIAR